VEPADLARMRVNYTVEPSADLLAAVRLERSRSRVRMTIPDDWCIADRGEDMTDELIVEAFPCSEQAQRCPGAGGPDPRAGTTLGFAPAWERAANRDWLRVAVGFGEL
jgi:hypothetical protein